MRSCQEARQANFYYVVRWLCIVLAPKHTNTNTTLALATNIRIVLSASGYTYSICKRIKWTQLRHSNDQCPEGAHNDKTHTTHIYIC